MRGDQLLDGEMLDIQCYELASYFGLAPRVRRAGIQNDMAHYKEGNRMVRMLLIQAALVHTRRVRDRSSALPGSGEKKR